MSLFACHRLSQAPYKSPWAGNMWQLLNPYANAQVTVSKQRRYNINYMKEVIITVEQPP